MGQRSPSSALAASASTSRNSGQGDHSPTLHLDEWLAEWGVVRSSQRSWRRGEAEARRAAASDHTAATQGGKPALAWQDHRLDHRAELKSRGVEMVGGVNYEQIGDQGLLVSYGEKRENATWLDVDNIILCAGQVPCANCRSRCSPPASKSRCWAALMWRQSWTPSGQSIRPAGPPQPPERRPDTSRPSQRVLNAKAATRATRNATPTGRRTGLRNAALAGGETNA